MDKNNHRKLNEDLTNFIAVTDRGELCMYSVIEWIQENLDKYSYVCSSSNEVLPGDTTTQEDDSIFTRLWVYSHHIYDKFKRRDIIDWAEELKLTGFSLPGRPGVVCVEGYSRPVDEYWHRLKKLNWKKLLSKRKMILT